MGDWPTGAEAWHSIGDPGEPAFQNSFANWGTPHATAAFFKDSHGIVHLRGFLSVPAALNVAFALPAGYRPALIENFALICAGGIGRAQLNQDGSLQFLSPTVTSNWASIAGLSFRAEQ